MIKENPVLVALRRPATTGNGVANVEFRVGKQTVYTGATGEFELMVGKRKAHVLAVEGWKIVSGAEIEAGETVTIVVDH
jgi:hypothetical protein